jgi:hypothetical protein
MMPVPEFGLTNVSDQQYRELVWAFDSKHDNAFKAYIKALTSNVLQMIWQPEIPKGGLKHLNYKSALRKTLTDRKCDLDAVIPAVINLLRQTRFESDTTFWVHQIFKEEVNQILMYALCCFMLDESKGAQLQLVLRYLQIQPGSLLEVFAESVSKPFMKSQSGIHNLLTKSEKKQAIGDFVSALPDPVFKLLCAQASFSQLVGQDEMSGIKSLACYAKTPQTRKRLCLTLTENMAHREVDYNDFEFRTDFLNLFYDTLARFHQNKSVMKALAACFKIIEKRFNLSKLRQPLFQAYFQEMIDLGPLADFLAGMAADHCTIYAAYDFAKIAIEKQFSSVGLLEKTYVLLIASGFRPHDVIAHVIGNSTLELKEKDRLTDKFMALLTGSKVVKTPCKTPSRRMTLTPRKIPGSSKKTPKRILTPHKRTIFFSPKKNRHSAAFKFLLDKHAKPYREAAQRNEFDGIKTCVSLLENFSETQAACGGLFGSPNMDHRTAAKSVLRGHQEGRLVFISVQNIYDSLRAVPHISLNLQASDELMKILNFCAVLRAEKLILPSTAAPGCQS